MILITGATGLIGRETAKLAVEAGHAVTGTTRDPAAVLPAGVELLLADPADPGALADSLDGIEAILLAPRAIGESIRELLATAAKHGRPRVVLLSAITVEYGGGYERFAAEFRDAEAAVRDSGLPWTFLRCADFAANTLAWAPQIRATGVVRGAYAAAATSAIHERDIAETAVRALTSDAHAGQTYAITGPRSLSQGEKVRQIGAAIGSGTTFQEVPPDEVRAAMLARGYPADVPDRMLGYQHACLQEPGPTTQTVERLLGRPALDFARWAADHAADFTA